MSSSYATVYIVDDDQGVRDALAWLLRSRRLTSECFDSAEAFDARISQPGSVREPSCVLLDVRMAKPLRPAAHAACDFLNRPRRRAHRSGRRQARCI